MIIEKLKINNYRQYKGEVIIDFGMAQNKNINIVIGSNGAGKTNLSNAIQWCFYGMEPSLKKEYMEFGILNMELFDDLEDGKCEEVSVEISLKLDNGEIYSIERKLNIGKRNNKQEIIPFENAEKDGSKLKAYFHGKGTHTLDEYFPSRLISILAPEKISEFFFFDGEKLEKYFNYASSEKIKDSIFKISQLDVLARMEERLECVIHEYRQETKGISPNSDELVKNIVALEKELKEKDEKIKNNEKQYHTLKDARQELQKKYKEFNGPEIKRIIERNEQIEETISQQSNRLNEKIKEKREIVLKNVGMFIARRAFDSSLELFSEARKKKIIPPNISHDFIQELLNKGVCICKTDVSKKNIKNRKNLEELLGSMSKLGSNIDELSKIENDMLNIKNSKLSSILNNVKLLNDFIKDTTNQLNELKKELEENIAKIGNVKIDKDKIINYEDKNNELNEKIEEIRGEVEVLKAKKQEIEWRLKEKEGELKKESQKQEKGRVLNRLIEFSEKSKNHASEIQEKIMKEIRQEISKETEEHYKELHWKKNEKVDIIIDENYKISAMQNNHNKFGAFAAGEMALLTMSFLIALNHVSGFKVPIVMDTALGRISTGPRENFAKNIASYLKDNQVILLFTQAEFSPEVKNNLAPYINHQYTIDLSKSNLAAKIKEK